MGKADSMCSLPKLNETLNNYTMKELNVLKRKNAELIKEYNKSIHDYRIRHKHYESLLTTERELVGPDPMIDVKMKNELQELMDNLLSIEKNKYKSHEIQERMQRIIEICEINTIQNEEWIRG